MPCAIAAGLLAVAVESEWDPFRSLDQRSADALHRQALAHPGWTRVMTLASRIGGPTEFRVLVALLAVLLWMRGARRLAFWAAVTMAAAALLDVLGKAVVNRVRPALPHPVAHAPGASFPSGHALTAVVGCGIIVLTLLPLLSATGRRVAWVVAGLVAGVVGYSRVALGVHWVTDVVGGWLLGAGLLAATTAAFEIWRAERGRPPVRPLAEGVAPEESEEVTRATDTAEDEARSPDA